MKVIGLDQRENITATSEKLIQIVRTNGKGE